MPRRAFCALALTLASFGLGPAATAAEFLGRHIWTPDWPGAGGYSALELAPDGRAFVALSDRDGWVTGQLVRDAAGVVVAVEVEGHGALLRSDGEVLEGTLSDAEGLTQVGDVFFVSFEHLHRVMRHSPIDATPERVKSPRDFNGLQANSGLEALASDAQGRLYAIPERSGALERPFPVYRYDGQRWDTPFAIRRDGPYLVTGADIGPDGRLYVLERDFILLGFRSRVRSFDLTGGDERLELESPLGRHQNLEGISVWRDETGRLRLTMISDDNQRAILHSEFVDYALDP